jgi:hypothetical protein
LHLEVHVFKKIVGLLPVAFLAARCNRILHLLFLSIFSFFHISFFPGGEADRAIFPDFSRLY